MMGSRRSRSSTSSKPLVKLSNSNFLVLGFLGKSIFQDVFDKPKCGSSLDLHHLLGVMEMDCDFLTVSMAYKEAEDEVYNSAKLVRCWRGFHTFDRKVSNCVMVSRANT